jgi:nucleoside-diphosphate-sugar epimerase
VAHPLKWRLARSAPVRACLHGLGGLAMRVLVARERGYIGAVLVPFLRAAGHGMAWLDLGLHGGCDLGPGPESVEERPPWDPLGDLNPAATYPVNLEETLRLARAAKLAGTERLLFAPSCSYMGAATRPGWTSTPSCSRSAVRPDQGGGRA